MTKFNCHWFGRLWKAISITLFMLVMTGAHAQDSAQNRFDGFVSVGSADVYRGLQRHGKDLALQGGLRVRISEAFFAGMHLSQSQFPSGPGTFSGDIEFDYFVGWSALLPADIAVQLRFTRYTYPGSSDRFYEHDQNEVMLGLEFPGNLSLTVSAADSGLSFLKGSVYAQLLWGHPLPRGFDFSAAVGGGRTENQSYRSYGYWDAGVSHALGPFMVDLRYHYSPASGRWYGRAYANGQWVISVTKGW